MPKSNEAICQGWGSNIRVHQYTSGNGSITDSAINIRSTSSTNKSEISVKSSTTFGNRNSKSELNVRSSRGNGKSELSVRCVRSLQVSGERRTNKEKRKLPERIEPQDDSGLIAMDVDEAPTAKRAKKAKRENVGKGKGELQRSSTVTVKTTFKLDPNFEGSEQEFAAKMAMGVQLSTNRGVQQVATGIQIQSSGGTHQIATNVQVKTELGPSSTEQSGVGGYSSVPTGHSTTYFDGGGFQRAGFGFDRPPFMFGSPSSTFRRPAVFEPPLQDLFHPQQAPTTVKPCPSMNLQTLPAPPTSRALIHQPQGPAALTTFSNSNFTRLSPESSALVHNPHSMGEFAPPAAAGCAPGFPEHQPGFGNPLQANEQRMIQALNWGTRGNTFQNNVATAQQTRLFMP